MKYNKHQMAKGGWFARTCASLMAHEIVAWWREPPALLATACRGAATGSSPAAHELPPRYADGSAGAASFSGASHSLSTSAEVYLVPERGRCFEWGWRSR